MSAAVKAARPAVNGWNAEYLEAQYELWRHDPASVEEGLSVFFQGFELARASSAPASPSATAASAGAAAARLNGVGAHTTSKALASDGTLSVAAVGLTSEPAAGSVGVSLNAGVAALMHHYRDLGHLCAAIDPFGRERPCPPELTPEFHGLTEADLDTVCSPALSPLDRPGPIREIIASLDETYCRSVGIEYMHMSDVRERLWLASRVEKARNKPDLDRGDRAHVLERLIRAEAFEKFLHTRYPGEKRFSLEGAESVIPLLDRIVEQSPEMGIEEIVLGMAHRGRLNVLCNILGKTYEQIFTEFEDNFEDDFADGGGDVKYHKGYSGERVTRFGKKVWLAMASNPSHLESVDPVVQGRSRGKQRVRADKQRTRVAPILIHGDAAVIAQGVVPETLNLSLLEGYSTGGTVHVVINNLIGFTTGEEDARSSRYCTDVAKMIEAPVIHVNGEDPEACVWAAQLALEYRQQFHKDVFIDVLCYRKWGHNESDEPSFTQPQMYALIREKESVLSSYAKRLRRDGIIGEKDADEIRRRLEEAIDKAQAASKLQPFDPTIDPGSRRWKGFDQAFSHNPAETKVALPVLQEVARAMGRVPEGFDLNRKLVGLFKARAASCDNETNELDYATAESLAFGALLVEGAAVRLSGQDCRRGTFSHRHAAVRDANTGESYIPLNHIREIGEPGGAGPVGEPGSDGRPRQARFCVHNSPLSEMAVVGFEYGYSLTDPNMLVMWEAQFGDFANGAQVIFDQYLSAAELKWQRWSGLTLLLPHGYEGAGPEHSSARLERFLQLCGDDNMQVVYPSNASQIFHVLRRQVKRTFRLPLILMTPKSMLRVNTSRVADLVHGRFLEIIDDPAFAPLPWDKSAQPAASKSGVRRIVLCTGKLYHELDERRRAISKKDVAIIRVEQLYPLHVEALKETLASYPREVEVIWAQEEPQNMGAFRFMEAELRERVGLPGVRYVGRPRSGTPATGSKTQHKKQQESILSGAVGPLPSDGGKGPGGNASLAPAGARG
ncbi:MAG: 2-oxoglutarate dehydrogenase E1 component [Phycisphaerales bacterium]